MTLSDLHKKSHTPDAIRKRFAEQKTPSYLKDAIYGAIDGAVTTFAVVSGVAGAGLSSGIVIVLGLANLVGDGFSMAASNYLGSRAEEQVAELARQEEEVHIDLYPEGEREEVRQLLMARGFEGEVLEKAVEVVTSDRKRWVDMMLQDEYGLALEGLSPIRAAVVTFVAFIAVGSLPLVAFLPALFSPEVVPNPFLWSSLLTAAAFFGVGAAKSRVVSQKWYLAGLGAVGIFSPVGILSPGVGQGLNMLRICSGEKSNLDKDALGE
ncbi:MAG: VIT1/CCC1 transporter family protein, partial [Vulcanimicrobiota bacterium]